MIRDINSGVYTDISENDMREIQQTRLNNIINSSTHSYHWQPIPKGKTKVAKYMTDIFVDGPGVRNCLYVTHCPFKCDDCYNESIQYYRNGDDYTSELHDKIIKDLGKKHIQGLSLLGGEPFLNAPTLLELVKNVRQEYGDSKDIWVWTGYLYDTLNILPETDSRKQMLELVDVIVDGQYIKEYRDESNPPIFKGSSNQRIIDVKKSKRENKVITIDF